MDWSDLVAIKDFIVEYYKLLFFPVLAFCLIGFVRLMVFLVVFVIAVGFFLNWWFS